MSFRTREPQNLKVQEIDFSDRLQRIKRAYDNADPNGQVYWIPDRTSDVFELRTIRYKQKYPNDVSTNISWMCRILLPRKNMFELDKESGTLDSNHKVKQALVYAINESVDNPNLEEGPVGYSSVIGWYQSPLIRYSKHDEFGNGTDPVIERMKNIFYIEYKPELVDDILSKMSNEISSMGVAVANEFGERWPTTHSVRNLQEFKEAEDIQALIEASQHAYLRNDYGGYKEFLEARSEAKKSYKPIKAKKYEP